MVCPKCNTNNVQGAQFCSVCGTTLAVYQPVQAPVAPPPAPTYQAPPVYQQPVQPVPQAPVYQQPVQQVPIYQAAPVYSDGFDYEKDKMNWSAIAGMVCGIISIFACLLNGYLALLLGIGGIVFGCIGLKSNKRGFAIAGLACGIVCIALYVLLVIGVFSLLGYTYY